MPTLVFVDNPGDGGGGTPPEPAGAPDPQAQTFTQADVDRIVKERVQREKAKFADYDDLKAKAGQSKTLEERLAEVEQRAAKAEAAALRSDIAAKFGIGAEDRDLFLTGADEETLTAQAQRLAQREADRKKQGNVAPREGGNPNPDGANGDLRAFTRALFAPTGD
jgi:hypothetical protein